MSTLIANSALPSPPAIAGRVLASWLCGTSGQEEGRYDGKCLPGGGGARAGRGGLGAAGRAQNITFGALSNQPINAAPFTVSAMASSGLPVGFSSTTTTTCTVSADTVMLVAAGRCAIKASQAGNVDYDGATPVTQAFTITKLTQTIDFPSLQNQTLGTAPFTISATASSGLTVSFASTTTTVCTVTGDTVTLVATGHCSIKATEAGNGTYDAAKPVEQGFQVKQ